MGSKKANKNKRDKSSESSKPPTDGDGGGGGGSEIITDARFASVHSDPRFQKVPKHKAKVEIDSRFDRVFRDKSFASSAAPVDKRGKPKKKQDSQNFLRHYYRIEENKDEEKEEQESVEEEEKKEEEEGKSLEVAKRDGEESETESSSESETSEEEDEAESSELDTDEDEDELLRVEIDEEPEALEEHIPEIEKETHRLAVVNMDWRYVKAADLYMMLSPFLPKDGQIVSVSVYPSEFGLQRMKEEEVHGPVGLFDEESEKSGDDSDNENDNDEKNNEKLRAYEKSRLRYYFAVVECDSIATADCLYKACDGVEFERSSNVLDLRFIPNSMEFKHPPRDVATEAPANYEGLNFQTQALQQSKIHLSWDEDEPERVKTLKRKFNADQLEELELKDFLASDESESDDTEDDNVTEDQQDKKQKKRDMYRALLQSGGASDGEDEEEGQDMEVTFNTGLEDISKRILEKKDKKQETVWEAKLREQRERKKRRKNRSKHSSEDESTDTDQEAIEEPDDFFIEEEEPSVKKRKKSDGETVRREKKEKDTSGQAEATKDELELLLADDTVADKKVKGYKLKPKKVKGKDGKRVKEILDEGKIPPIADDPRFSSLFTSPDFAMDPTDPQFKRSATYARQVALRKQKSQDEFAERESLVPPELQADADERVKSDGQPSKREKYELSTLLKSVKMKSRQVKLPSDGNASKKGDGSKASGVEGKKKREVKDEYSTLVQSLKKKTKNVKK